MRISSPSALDVRVQISKDTEPSRTLVREVLVVAVGQAGLTQITAWSQPSCPRPGW